MFSLSRGRSIATIATLTFTVVAGASAFIGATTVGSDAAPAYDVTAPDDELELQLADPAVVGDPRLFLGEKILVEVAATNPTGVPVKLAPRRELRPQLSVTPLPGHTCPNGSFKVDRVRRTQVVVPPTSNTPPGSEPVIVGSFRLAFHDKPKDQTGCVGAKIDFTWP